MTKEELIAQVNIERNKLSSMYPIEPFKVEMIVDSIIECIRQLNNLTSDEINKQGHYVSEWHMLIHTRGKEVNLLRSRYEEMRKPRAAQKRQVEFDQFYAELVSRINRETIRLR